MQTDGLRYAGEVITWRPLLIAAAGSIVITATARQGEAFPLQASAILLGAAAAFALDDPMFEILGASPTSLARRRATRLAVVLTPIVVFWMALVIWHGNRSSAASLTLTTMFTGLLSLSFGISGIAGRRSQGRGGPVAAPAILAALIVSGLLPTRWRPLPLGDVPGGFATIRARWALAAVVGVFALVVSSRDLAGRRSQAARPSDE